MIDNLRQQFSAAYSDEKYARLKTLLEERAGCPVPFRVCETPGFFTEDSLDQLARLGRELTEQIVGNSSYLEMAQESIPTGFRIPNIASQPLFVQADFGYDENLEPKLVEIQGFPSLYGFQPLLAETFRDVYELDSNLGIYMSGMDAASYRETLRTLICADTAPEETFLLELYPEQQKTRPDFLVTEKLLGVRAVCATQVKQVGNQLFTPDGTPIKRIYNRLIFDDLVRQNVTLPFDATADLNVTWAGHPAWYFLLSKLSLPYFKHSCVPETYLLSEISKLPADLEEWVLKPLFSYAGQGVTVGPTKEQIQAVTEPTQWLLQHKVHFVPTVDTPEGPTKVEVRLMCLWTEDGLKGAIPLLRMGRGALMGVDQNRDARWIGASAALFI
ncbi:MAG: hypothetical protein QM758_28445 [Armatimonas sp.]